jgi:hypothetical protein
MGYAVTDVRGPLTDAVVEQLRAMPEILRVDVLPA